MPFHKVEDTYTCPEEPSNDTGSSRSSLVRPQKGTNPEKGFVPSSPPYGDEDEPFGRGNQTTPHLVPTRDEPCAASWNKGNAVLRTRPKDLGTKHETRIVNAAQDAGLIAERIAEGGQYDIGDVRIWAEDEWILEAKDRERLNVHQALENAQLKSGTTRTAVVWRRMVRKPGNTNRTQDGPIVVALDLDSFLRLLKGTTE